jgi:hypothetical protein
MTVKGEGRAACPPFAFRAVAPCSKLLYEVACGSRSQPEERRADDSALRLALPRMLLPIGSWFDAAIAA